MAEVKPDLTCAVQIALCLIFLLALAALLYTRQTRTKVSRTLSREEIDDRVAKLDQKYRNVDIEDITSGKSNESA